MPIPRSAKGSRLFGSGPSGFSPTRRELRLTIDISEEIKSIDLRGGRPAGIKNAVDPTKIIRPQLTPEQKLALKDVKNAQRNVKKLGFFLRHGIVEACIKGVHKSAKVIIDSLVAQNALIPKEAYHIGEHYAPTWGAVAINITPDDAYRVQIEAAQFGLEMRNRMRLMTIITNPAEVQRLHLQLTIKRQMWLAGPKIDVITGKRIPDPYSKAAMRKLLQEGKVFRWTEYIESLAEPTHYINHAVTLALPSIREIFVEELKKQYKKELGDIPKRLSK